MSHEPCLLSDRCGKGVRICALTIQGGYLTSCLSFLASVSRADMALCPWCLSYGLIRVDPRRMSSYPGSSLARPALTLPLSVILCGFLYQGLLHFQIPTASRCIEHSHVTSSEFEQSACGMTAPFFFFFDVTHFFMNQEALTCCRGDKGVCGDALELESFSQTCPLSPPLPPDKTSPRAALSRSPFIILPASLSWFSSLVFAVSFSLLSVCVFLQVWQGLSPSLLIYLSFRFGLVFLTQAFSSFIHYPSTALSLTLCFPLCHRSSSLWG